MRQKIRFGHTGPTGWGVSDGLFQVLGHCDIVRVRTQDVQDHQLQGPENHVYTPVK